MLGVCISLLSASLYSLRGIYSKKVLSEIPSYTLASMSRIFSVIPILGLMLVTRTTFSLSLSGASLLLLIAMFLGGAFSNVLVFKALEHLSVGTFSSMNSVGVVFTALFSALFLREFPTATETICILVITLLCISLSSSSLSPMKMFSEFFKSKGVVYVLLVQVFFAANAIVMRIWTQTESPLTLAFYLSLGQGLAIIPFALRQERGNFKVSWLKNKNMLLMALFTGTAIATSFLSRKLLPAPVEDSLLSTMIVFSVVFGGIMLNERHTRQSYVKFSLVFAAAAALAII